MKTFIVLLLLTGALASCAPSGKSPTDTRLIDEAHRRRIIELESQLDLQRHHSERWQSFTVTLGIGCVALLILGTSLGAKTRHDAALPI
jgi:hypothetical protein